MSERSAVNRQLRNHPARKIVTALLAYGTTKDIFAMNCFEVLHFTAEIESGRFSEMALDPNRRLEYRDFENHLIRYFHNFLASAKTLVDHTRNMMNSDVVIPEHREAYQKQVDLDFSDELTKFISDFRNYTLHYGVPHTAHSFLIVEEKWKVTLVLREIKKWDGWKSKSQRFLEAHPDEISVSWLVGAYQKKAITFHTWLIGSFTTYYGALFSDLDVLRAKEINENPG